MHIYAYYFWEKEGSYTYLPGISFLLLPNHRCMIIFKNMKCFQRKIFMSSTLGRKKEKTREMWYLFSPICMGEMGCIHQIFGISSSNLFME